MKIICTACRDELPAMKGFDGVWWIEPHHCIVDQDRNSTKTHNSKMEKVMRMIYIASPYSVGNKLANVNRQIDAGERLMQAGYCPVIPLYSHYHEKRYPHEYDVWLEIDHCKLSKCDALLRLSGDSPGADQECEWAQELHIPVFHSIMRLRQYV